MYIYIYISFPRAFRLIFTCCSADELSQDCEVRLGLTRIRPESPLYVPRRIASGWQSFPRAFG